MAIAKASVNSTIDNIQFPLFLGITNVIAIAQCEWTLRDFFWSTGIVPGKAKNDSVGGLVNNFGNVDIILQWRCQTKQQNFV